ncbi:UDP-N-acetylmuramate--L-alanine ligase [Candidatus Omnitrophota bacterium]
MIKHIHLIGIGGIGMSAIAQLLLKQGWKVSGCDLKQNELTAQLKSLGIRVWIGHDAGHLEQVDTVAYSSAVGESNPEIQEAKRRGMRLMKRAEILSLLMQDKTVITVTGMHGKTTTASLASYLLSEARLFPTAAVGGILMNLGGNALTGEGRYFVAEADESDGSFLCYHPDYSLITNIDYEHMDYYRDFSAIQTAFRTFIEQTKPGGILFCWQDDPYLRGILKGYRQKVVYFGLGLTADVSASNIRLQGLTSEFDCLRKQKFFGHFKLCLGGNHNILNALAVIALAAELEIDAETIKAALFNYKGTRRRLEEKFRSAEVLVLDDYGHHPAEIKATLEAVKLLNPRRLLVIFQPHRYTRTKFLLDDFAGCFTLADYVVITDIYPAGETEIPGVSGYSIYERLIPQKHQQAKFLAKDDILDFTLSILKPQDIVLFLGAGDITKISDELAKVLKDKGNLKGRRASSKAYQL